MYAIFHVPLIRLTGFIFRFVSFFLLTQFALRGIMSIRLYVYGGAS